MRFFLVSAVAGLLLVFSRPCHADDDAAMTHGEKIIESILRQILTGDAGRPYFKTVDPATIELGFRRNNRSGGWIWEWSFSKNAKSIPNPDKEGQIAMVDEIETSDGIVFHIFIAEGHGDNFVSRQKTYEVSGNPRLHVGYWYETAKPDPDFEHSLDKIIRSSSAIDKNE